MQTTIPLSIVYIVKNGGNLFALSLKSVAEWADEIIVLDNKSTDSSRQIAKAFGAHVYRSSQTHLGALRDEALSYASNNWILILDHDEIPSSQLLKTISRMFHAKKTPPYAAYTIAMKNHLFGKPLNYGGETYTKLVLFNKKHVNLIKASIHEKYIPRRGVKVGHITAAINHYSYRTLPQLYSKFTDYALRDAREKHQHDERASFKKLFFYAPHMLWARYVKDKGYKDGVLRRLPLDIGFAYTEALTYWTLLVYTIHDELQSSYRHLQNKGSRTK